MKYNAEYDRWVTTGGLVYRYSKSKDKLVLCKQTDNGNGYFRVHTNKGIVKTHRLVYETFKGKIPNGYEIDHEDTHKDNNALSNLKLCTHKENCNNPLTKKNKSETRNGEFGIKFKEHYGISRFQDIKLYNKEWRYHKKHNKCSWE